MGTDVNDPQLGDAKPLVVTVIDRGQGTGPLTGTGDGGVIQTPTGQPNIILKGVKPLMMILVRALRVFLQTLVGLVTAGIVSPNTLPAKDFLHLIGICAGLSVASAVICIIQNAIELLGQIDQSHPTLAG